MVPPECTALATESSALGCGPSFAEKWPTVSTPGLSLCRMIRSSCRASSRSLSLGEETVVRCGGWLPVCLKVVLHPCVVPFRVVPQTPSLFS